MFLPRCMLNLVAFCMGASILVFAGADEQVPDNSSSQTFCKEPCHLQPSPPPPPEYYGSPPPPPPPAGQAQCPPVVECCCQYCPPSQPSIYQPGQQPYGYQPPSPPSYLPYYNYSASPSFIHSWSFFFFFLFFLSCSWFMLYY